LSRKLSQWTNHRWVVVVSAEPGEPTIKAQNEARQADLKTGVRADPLVQAVLARFPGAEIVSVRERGEAAQVGQEEAMAGEPTDDAIPEPPPVDDGSGYEADWRPEDQDDVP
jgi:DNA polymerase-3 subunit gamma/tau